MTSPERGTLWGQSIKPTCGRPARVELVDVHRGVPWQISGIAFAPLWAAGDLKIAFRVVLRDCFREIAIPSRASRPRASLSKYAWRKTPRTNRKDGQCDSGCRRDRSCSARARRPRSDRRSNRKRSFTLRNSCLNIATLAADEPRKNSVSSAVGIKRALHDRLSGRRYGPPRGKACACQLSEALLAFKSASAFFASKLCRVSPVRSITICVAIGILRARYRNSTRGFD